MTAADSLTEVLGSSASPGPASLDCICTGLYFLKIAAPVLRTYRVGSACCFCHFDFCLCTYLHLQGRVVEFVLQKWSPYLFKHDSVGSCPPVS